MYPCCLFCTDKFLRKEEHSFPAKFGCEKNKSQYMEIESQIKIGKFKSLIFMHY